MGSGYRIAMRDLTIRGAGDLLGQEQSGFIDTVGIDMYIEMLEEAIQRRQGHVSVEKEEGIKHAQTPVSGYLPEDFAPDDYDKISMYQKIDALSNLGELESYRREVTDQYGRLPQEVETLFQRRQLDILCADPDVDSYKDLDGKGELTFSTLYSQKVDGVKLFEILNGISKDLKLSFRNGRIRVEIPRMKNQLEVTLEILQRAKEAYKDHAD
jgi:transcription-repair coupling factor (superfamily II helicase)